MDLALLNVLGGVSTRAGVGGVFATGLILLDDASTTTEGGGGSVVG